MAAIDQPYVQFFVGLMFQIEDKLLKNQALGFFPFGLTGPYYIPHLPCGERAYVSVSVCVCVSLHECVEYVCLCCTCVGTPAARPTYGRSVIGSKKKELDTIG